MRFHPALRRGVLVLSLSGAALPAGAGDDCDAPVSRWQPRDAVRQMAAAKGWQIQRLKIDDGCYEIRATDAEGHDFKARLDPETLVVLKTRPAGTLRERARERDRDGAARQGRGRAPDGASAPSAASSPGTSRRANE